MKRYLITGGAGFIGTAITKKLLEEKHFVRILDNESRGSMERFPKNAKNIELINSDIRNYSGVLRASEGIDSIIHLAYINGTRFFYEKPDLVLDVGVKGMLNVLDAARAQKVSELFLASSSEVYQNPPLIPTPENVPLVIPKLHNPRYSYAGGKIISELLSLYVGRTFLKRVVIFRPHNVYGPNMGTEHVIPELIVQLKQLLQKNGSHIKLRLQGDGTETRSFIYIDDFISGVLCLLQKGKNQEIYNVGTSEEVTIKHIVTVLARLVNKQITIIPSKSPKGSVKRRYPDMQKMTKLGFLPKINLGEGLRRTFLWYNAQR